MWPWVQLSLIPRPPSIIPYIMREENRARVGKKALHNIRRGGEGGLGRG